MKKLFVGTKPYIMPLVYIILFNIIVVIAVVAIHESGHFFVGNSFGCTNIKVVLLDSSSGSTYTQMSCPPETPVEPLLLAGFIFTTPIALLLSLMRGFPERYFYMVILGFNLMISSSDIITFVRYNQLFILAGTILIIIGEMLLIEKLLIMKEKIRDRYDV